jgi:hypothetical protein
VDERLLASHLDGLNDDAVVARRERPLVRAQRDEQVARIPVRDPKSKSEPVRVAEPLFALAANRDVETALSGRRRRAAVLDVEVESQDVAPILGLTRASFTLENGKSTSA